MAEIISTELKVYSGTTTAGSQIGNTITQQGSPATVALDSTSLGANLSAGEQYCVIARCTNDEEYTTDWTQPYPFKTLILAEIITISGNNGVLNAELSFTYNDQVLSIQDCGVYVSTNANGTNAQKISAGDEQTAEQWQITNLSENTRYYVIPYVVDNVGDGREYKGNWAEAEEASTGYSAPVVNISNIVTTYNSLSGNVTVTSNDTLQSVKLSIIPTGGGSYQYITLNAQTGTQQWSITNGDLDDNDNPITINPSTEYRIAVNAVNTSGGSGSDAKTATTLQQSTETIAITGINNITPTSATVNLSYGG